MGYLARMTQYRTDEGLPRWPRPYSFRQLFGHAPLDRGLVERTVDLVLAGITPSVFDHREREQSAGRERARAQ